MAIDPALVQWDDEPVSQAIDPSQVVWDDDPGAGGLEIDIVGGTPESAAATSPKVAPQPSLFRSDSDFQERSGLGGLNMLGAAARDMFGTRDSAAKYLAEKTGGQVGKDEEGNALLTLTDGTSYRLNDDGIDSTDVANVAGNALAFLTPAAWAARVGKARNLGLGARTALQGATAGGTDLALQGGFSGGTIDPVRSAATVAGGGAGELVGSGIAAGVRRAGAARRGLTGANIDEARRFAIDAGVPNPTGEQVSRLAQAMDEIRAGADPRAILGRDEFGFIYTQGQRATDPARKFELLSREELLRQSPGGNAPFQAATRNNVEQLDSAISGITERAGARAGATPAEMAAGAQGRLASQADELGRRISEAYERAGAGNRAAIDAASVSTLPDRLRAAVSEFSPNPSITPAAAKTLEQVRLATETILRGAEGGNVRGVTLKALETQRRILNNNIGAAANPTDRAATTAIKREFDRWMDEAVDGALVSGDASALQAIKEARGLRAEFGRRFEGRGEADKFIAGLLDGSRTPEELVNIALGAGQVSKAGGARFIERLRVAADGDPEVINSLKTAHLLRMTRGSNGETVPMGQMVRNIRTTEYNNASIVKALYSPQEWAEIRRLASSLEPLVAKGDFARSSGTAERTARMLFQRVGGGLPLVGDVVQAIGSVRNTVQANRAINQPLQLPGGATPAAPASMSAVAAENAR